MRVYMDKFVTKIANYWNNLELSTLLIGLGVLIILWSFCSWILKKMKLTPPGADRTLQEIDNMTGAEFEEFVAAVIRGNGYEVIEMTKTTGDFGADIIASKNGENIAVQCKRYAKPVGVKAVQEAISAMKHYDCDSCLVVTNSRFTKQAMELANDNEVVGLWDRNFLVYMRNRAEKKI
jgi:HJR/Mrr/RecB family endonuclease